MRDTRKMLEEINFEGAFHEYRETTNLDVLHDELWPVGYELAYIYLNAGKLTEGAFLLSETRRHLDCAGKLPLRLQGQPLPDKTDTRAQLEHLRQCEPDYFLQMEYRYFPKMVFIKGGTFDMGDVMGDKLSDREAPVHSVTVGDYELSETPQTWWHYGLYCFAQGIETPADSGFGKGNRPVINVSWEDAVKYAEWLSAHRNEKFRLPTEAEWEFAARERGRKVRFGNGKDVADAREMNFRANVESDFSLVGEYREKTTDVKEFLPNTLGLYDMSGNVLEWCEDWLKPYPGGTSEDYTGSARVLRGGSWGNDPQGCRVAYRHYDVPGYRNDHTGFRLARTK
jgi:formylglycine-generating enzyme required for sulfatase activity